MLFGFTSLLYVVWFNSETVKFGHVTFFWNGNRSGYFNPEMEEYVEVPSDSGITFNVKPKMKAVEIAEKARDAILSGKFQQVISLLIFCTHSLLTTWLAIMKNGSSCLDINSMMTITLF